MSNLTKTPEARKPPKPYPDFPLFAHATGRWAKKIRGKLCYFGPWDNADAALERYLNERDDLYAGRKPRTSQEAGLTVQQLLTRFYRMKEQLLATGEIVKRTLRDYYATCASITTALGKTRSLKI